jgi:hypothetical protein
VISIPIAPAAILATGLLLGGLLGPLVAHAEPRVAPPYRPVLLQVMVVHAAKEEGKIDPPCQSLKHTLLRDFGTLRLMKKERFKLRMGERGHMQLPAGHSLQFLPISVLDRELHMHVQIPGVVNTQMRLQSGPGMILGGVKHDDGVLVIHLKPDFRIPRAPSEAAKKKRAERNRRHLLRTISDGNEADSR